MKQGVYLPDLIKRLDDLEGKVRNLESQPKHDANAELFAVMESSVCDDAEVKSSKRRVSDIRNMILTEMCMKDSRYTEALDEYRTTVNRVYIRKKEQAPHGGGFAEVCDDPERSISSETGVSSEQTAQ